MTSEIISDYGGKIDEVYQRYLGYTAGHFRMMAIVLKENGQNINMKAVKAVVESGKAVADIAALPDQMLLEKIDNLGNNGLLTVNRVLRELKFFEADKLPRI